MSVVRTIVLATCLFTIGACGQTSGGGATASPAPAAAQQPIDASANAAQADEGVVTAACGGGVTGGSSGVTLRSDHHVISWEKATAGAARTETDLGGDDTFFADILRRLQAAGFANINYNHAADLTCSLTADGHTVAWPQGDPNAPAKVLAIHDLLMSVSG